LVQTSDRPLLLLRVARRLPDNKDTTMIMIMTIPTTTAKPMKTVIGEYIVLHILEEVSWPVSKHSMGLLFETEKIFE
jgi:hypothetical protein